MSEQGTSHPVEEPVDRRALTRVALVALFVTSLATAQLIAAKLLAIPLPFEIPAVGAVLLLPGGAVAYALTFFASDCYAELYGRRPAQVMVNVAFAMNFVVLGLLATALWAPGADPEFSATFAEALAPAGNIVVGSLLAYVVSQNWDVIAFHQIREYTDGEMLWLRNVASTASSQAIDTVIFVVVAFAVAPAVFGIGFSLPLAEILALIVGQYLLKLLIAVLDTPFVYLVVGAVRDE